MSFVDCIQTAVDSGRVTPNKGAEAKQAYEDAIARGEAEGLAPDAAADAAADAAIKATTELKANARWQRINELRKQHEIYTRLGKSRNVRESLGGIIQGAADTYRAVAGQLERMVDSILLKYEPRLAGAYSPTVDMDNIVHAIYGKVVDPESVAMARMTQDLIVFTRKLLNLEGAAIPENPNFRLWQTHERDKVRIAGEEEWVRDHLNDYAGDSVLDWEVMRYQGKPIEAAEREAVLRKAWQAIVTDGKNRVEPGIANNETLANRLSRERFLYYKTSDAWLTMQDKYGNGNFYQQLVHHIDSTARDVSTMRTFGPNPRTGKGFTERMAQKRTGELQLEKPERADKLDNQLDKGLQAFDEAYRVHTRDVDTGAGDAVAMTIQAARTWSATQLLGSAIISNLSDPVYGMWMKMANRLPAGTHLTVIPRYFDAILHMKDFKRQVINNGIKYETLTNRAYESNRYNLALEGSHFTRAVADINYRLQGLAAFTQVGRGIAGLDIAEILAKSRDLQWDEIPFRDILDDHGITERDWGLMRDTPLYEPQYYSFGKGTFLRPIDMYEHAATDEGRVAANKFLTLQETLVREGIPFANLQVRTALGEALPAKRPYTQMLKSMSQLMLFPASIHYQYWRKIWHAPTVKDRLWLLGTFMAYSTVSGAMITQVKDVLNGKNPHPMNTKEFWIRAMLNGGAGGILGDFLYQGGLVLDSPYSANTPLGETLGNLNRATAGNAKDYYAGKDLHLGADLSRLAWGLFPFKLPGLKLVVERTIMDPILEQSDPAAYARKLKAQAQWEQDQGQGTWWGVGE